MRRWSLIVSLLLLSVSLTACDSAKSLFNPTDLPPVIQRFDADSIRIAPNTATTLRWEVSPANALVRIDPQPGNVPASGFVTIAPTTTTTYTLVARSDGGSSQRLLTILVAP